MLVITILFLLVAGAWAYSLLSLVAAVRFLAVPIPSIVSQEPISVLKPLAGLDEGLAENLRSFFEQKHSSFELIFALRSAADPAAAVVENLRAQYPKVPARLLITGEPPYPHAKVFSLVHLLREARHDLVVMSDSDIRVTPDFLSFAATEFVDGKIALATCPYRAIAGKSFWSRLEALGMNTTFWQGVLTARMLDSMKFAVGPTIVARRKAIDGIGGMESLKDFLAEDFELGRRVAESGANVILSRIVVEHRIGSETLRQNISHRIRWGRTSRRSRPLGYIGQIFTYPLPLAMLLALVAPKYWPVLAVTLTMRYVTAWMTSWSVLRVWTDEPLLPLEDVVGFVFWIAGFFGSTITWRGRVYRIDRDGKAAAEKK